MLRVVCARSNRLGTHLVFGTSDGYVLYSVEPVLHLLSQCTRNTSPHDDASGRLPPSLTIAEIQREFMWRPVHCIDVFYACGIIAYATTTESTEVELLRIVDVTATTVMRAPRVLWEMPIADVVVGLRWSPPLLVVAVNRKGSGRIRIFEDAGGADDDDGRGGMKELDWANPTCTSPVVGLHHLDDCLSVSDVLTDGSMRIVFTNFLVCYTAAHTLVTTPHYVGSSGLRAQLISGDGCMLLRMDGHGSLHLCYICDDGSMVERSHFGRVAGRAILPSISLLMLILPFSGRRVALVGCVSNHGRVQIYFFRSDDVPPRHRRKAPRVQPTLEISLRAADQSDASFYHGAFTVIRDDADRVEVLLVVSVCTGPRYPLLRDVEMYQLTCTAWTVGLG